MLEVVGAVAIGGLVLFVGAVVASEIEYRVRDWCDLRYCRACVIWKKEGPHG